MKPAQENTVLIALATVVVLVVVIAGAVTVIDRSHVLTFSDYIQDLTILASALGIGAGIAVARKE